jgi:hypothetical protein
MTTSSNRQSVDVPAGAALLPPIPAELEIQPLLLAVLHACVFLGGSDEKLVHPAAAEETLDAMLGYLGRLNGTECERLRLDIETLAAYGRQQKWGKAELRFLKELQSAIMAQRPESRS